MIREITILTTNVITNIFILNKLSPFLSNLLENNGKIETLSKLSK